MFVYFLNVSHETIICSYIKILVFKVIKPEKHLNKNCHFNAVRQNG